jgi:hypothetical protein
MQKVIGTEKQVIGNVYLGSNLYSRKKLESRQASEILLHFILDVLQ